ncbi:MAG: helix-hairpin-helix domain-containing protein [Thermodesulfobacteriota bacterium]
MKIDNVKGVGEKTAVLLSENGLKTVADLAAATVDQLCAIKGFGPSRAQAVIANAVEMAGEKVKKKKGKVKAKKKVAKKKSSGKSCKKTGKKKKKKEEGAKKKASKKKGAKKKKNKK